MTTARKQYLTPAEARQWLNSRGIKCSRDTMYDWCQKHGLAHRIGGRWFVSLLRLEAMLDETNPNPQYQQGRQHLEKSARETRGRKPRNEQG